jgi:REP element-mobilizing transposase RayT
MARARKRHVQVEIEFTKRGGRRPGAGRKRKCGRRRVPHTRRPDHCPRHPSHITLRVLDEVGRLRRRDAFKVCRRVMIEQAVKRTDFRVVHLSIQGNHIHMVCEADSRIALSRGTAGFKISAAKKLNKVRGRSGEVFADRYHEEPLTTPAQVRNCLAYVMNNWRRHGEDRDATSRVDPYSTGMWFTGWAEMQFTVPDGLEVLPSTPARTWLLNGGWQKCGRPISLYEVPGPRRP